VDLDFVHRFVPGALASAPTILTLHGTGGDENDLVPLARMIDSDSAILSPRGRVLENGNPRFFRRLAEGVFDQEDLRAQTLALGQFVDAAAAQYHFTRARVIALGYSNGANIAASLLLTTPGVLMGAILLRPMLPFEPATHPDLHGIPILISAGRRDPIVPRRLTERLAEVLAHGGATVTTLWQDTGHALSPGELEQVSAWWRQTFGE
jgi:phospholipase/carboxylesterase